MDQIQLTEQEQEKLETAEAIHAEASALQIKNQDTHTEGTDLLVRIQTKIREVEDIRDHQLAPIKAAKREIEEARKRTVAFFDQAIVPMKQIKVTLDTRMVGWRRTERRRAELEAERKRASEAKKIEEQKQKQERVAVGLEKKGLVEDAAEVRDRIEARPSPAPVAPTPKITTVPGATVKIIHRAGVADKIQRNRLIMAITAWNSENKDSPLVPGIYWQLDMDALDAFGQKTDGQIAVPGVEWYEEESTLARRRR